MWNYVAETLNVVNPPTGKIQLNYIYRFSSYFTLNNLRLHYKDQQ